jgi:hypothetical protein
MLGGRISNRARRCSTDTSGTCVDCFRTDIDAPIPLPNVQSRRHVLRQVGHYKGGVDLGGGRDRNTRLPCRGMGMAADSFEAVRQRIV